MWLSSSVCRIDVIATPREKSWGDFWLETAVNDSLLVRTERPTRGESFGKPFGSSRMARRSAERAHDPAGEDDPPGVEDPLLLLVERAVRLDAVAARLRAHGADLGLREHHSAEALGQVEVVLVEGVLGADAAARSCTRRTPYSRPAGAPCRRSRGPSTSTPGLPKKTATSVGWWCSGRPMSAASLLEDRGRPSGHARVACGAEHLEGRVVVGRELLLPVAQVRPALRLVERALGHRAACWHRRASRRQPRRRGGP